MQAVTVSTIRETLTATFPEAVVKAALTGPDGVKTDHFGLFRVGDEWQSIGKAVTSRYVPHTLDHVSALTEAALSAFGENSPAQLSACWHKDGHFVTLAPSREYRRSICGTKDDIFPRMIIEASYNGKAFLASIGWYRDACKNLARIKVAGREFSASIRHTNRLREKMPQLVDTFRSLAGQWENVVDTARDMQSREVNLSDFIASVYPMPENATAVTRRHFEETARAIVTRIIRERTQLLGSQGNMYRATAWEAYNGVQGYVQHDQRRRNSPSAMERAATAMDSPAVERALTLALAS